MEEHFLIIKKRRGQIWSGPYLSATAHDHARLCAFVRACERAGVHVGACTHARERVRAQECTSTGVRAQACERATQDGWDKYAQTLSPDALPDPQG